MSAICDSASTVLTPGEQLARRNAAGYFGLLSGILGASMLLPMPGADGHIAHIPDYCLFYNITGLPCPGCGLTRAFVCIGHGRFLQALHWHPLAWLVYATFVLLWIHTGLHALLGRRPITINPHLLKRIGYAAATVFLGTGILRMAWIITTHHNPF